MSTTIITRARLYTPALADITPYEWEIAAWWNLPGTTQDFAQSRAREFFRGKPSGMAPGGHAVVVEVQHEMTDHASEERLYESELWECTYYPRAIEERHCYRVRRMDV